MVMIWRIIRYRMYYDTLTTSQTRFAKHVGNSDAAREVLLHIYKSGVSYRMKEDMHTRETGYR